MLTVAGGGYLLLELPYETYIDPAPMIRLLAGRGFGAIVTPRAARNGAPPTECVAPWLQAGALLQLTAGSLLGAFGRSAEAAAWKWLEAGQASVVPSDAHDTHRRPPCMGGIERRLGAEVARRVCIENPAHVVRRGHAPSPALAVAGAPLAGTGRRRKWGSGVLRET